MVGSRQYAVHCRDGEEARLHELAALMSERVQQVSSGSPGLTEVRQLLFAGLLLADSLTDKAPAPAAAPPPPAEPEDESATLDALDALAQRIEALGDSLAAQLSNA
ncbi:cell division protein ZapA [Sphingobium sp. B1D7B]|nr:cell division protein ZapA [Sphingobium sp. B1D7B]